MRQAVFVAPRRVEVRDVPEPQRAAQQVLVSVGACGICTWEQRVFRGVRPEYPLLGGHEVGAVVLDAPASTGLRSGEVVAVSLLPRCGDCSFCRAGRSNLCSYAKAAGPHRQPHGPKGMSDLLVVPHVDVFPLAAAATCQDAALVEPTACVVHSLDRSGCRPGDLLAVFGLGFTGALHLAAARARGLRTVGIATARDVDGRAPVEADVIIEPDGRDAVRSIRAAVGSEVAAAVVTRGGSASIETAMEVVGLGGQVVLFESVTPSVPLDLTLPRLRSGEIMLTGSVSHTREDFAAAAALVASGAIPTEDLVGRSFELADVQRAMVYAVAHPGRRTMLLPRPR
ncbi:alcohol dehydrogenase catalytic domain-containing protein [Micromonospora sp. WMMD961]|uniref:alcohol dehydrogenase catalytic domain-containing protein n=1 Tax=Micromonospora sp. WMMD961 TaxID=3016100 RepID=UPI0024176B82|nr:alcohol dehydrogenase catalytic domain-containing protein [Micromonospora sp. WMMD961]MDG4780778.1 alcohol dehydrogenase catalytic domain-containing protein [Micromonospora sp. WMMD961]